MALILGIGMRVYNTQFGWHAYTCGQEAGIVCDFQPIKTSQNGFLKERGNVISRRQLDMEYQADWNKIPLSLLLLSPCNLWLLFSSHSRIYIICKMAEIIIWSLAGPYQVRVSHLGGHEMNQYYLHLKINYLIELRPVRRRENVKCVTS